MKRIFNYIFLRQGPYATFLLLLACCFAWITVYLGVIDTAPLIESYFWPPIRNIEYINIEHNGAKLCWSTRMHKTRGVILQSSTYWLNYDHVRIPLAVALNEQNVTGAGLDINPDNNPVIIGRYCALLPTEINNKSYIVNMRIYRSRFLWDLLITFPPLIVPEQIKD